MNRFRTGSIVRFVRENYRPEDAVRKLVEAWPPLMSLEEARIRALDVLALLTAESRS